MKKVVLSLAIISTLFSCSSDEVDSPITSTPSTYDFQRNGVSTVSYGGQTDRIKMGGEFVSALKNTSETVASLNAKFAHEAGQNNFSDASLNASSKSIRSKTAASKDFFSANTTDAAAIKNQFDSWITAQVNDVFPNWDNDAEKGKAGQIQEAGGGSKRYVNAKGIEYNQVIGKGLIGALMADQILNNYLSPVVLDEATNRADNTAGLVADGKNYTTMEHKWDEAFGYLYGTDNATDPELGKDSFLNKYLGKVDGDSDFAGIADQIYDAFKLGRAAIVAKDYSLRDQQANIIKEKVSEVIAVRAIYYLQQGKNNLPTDKAGAFHDLSEGLGFVYSLQFTRKPNSAASYFSKTEVDGFMTILQTGDGFWDLTDATIDQISNSIASKFNFTVAQAGS